MLHDFLETNRADLIDRCRARVVQRHLPQEFAQDAEHGMPIFLDQLIDRLRVGLGPESERAAAGPDGPSKREAGSEMGVSATRHGRELMARGFTVEQVVRDYGDLCQEITCLVMERGATIEVEEFRTLNLCLDDAIADAVTEFAYQRDLLNAHRGVDSLNERLGSLTHELRNLLQQAMYAVDVIKRGKAGLSGATGALLDRSLVAMTNLIDRTLAEVRTTAGMSPRRQIISLADFISDVKVSALLAADIAGCRLTVSANDPLLGVEADRDMLFSAVDNLLQNAFKFTRPGAEVKLNAYAEGKRILISVEDRCGGLPPGDAERMFLPFTQYSSDKSGVGLGLAICRRCTEANDGTLSVRNLPGFGCVFTMDLPRKSLSRPD